MIEQNCNLTNQKAGAEVLSAQLSMGFTLRLCLKMNKKRNKGQNRDIFHHQVFEVRMVFIF